jgi:hypothetical protein
LERADPATLLHWFEDTEIKGLRLCKEPFTQLQPPGSPGLVQDPEGERERGARRLNVG